MRVHKVHKVNSCKKTFNIILDKKQMLKMLTSFLAIINARCVEAFSIMKSKGSPKKNNEVKRSTVLQEMEEKINSNWAAQSQPQPSFDNMLHFQELWWRPPVWTGPQQYWKGRSQVAVDYLASDDSFLVVRFGCCLAQQYRTYDISFKSIKCCFIKFENRGVWTLTLSIQKPSQDVHQVKWLLYMLVQEEDNTWKIFLSKNKGGETSRCCQYRNCLKITIGRHQFGANISVGYTSFTL